MSLHGLQAVLDTAELEGTGGLTDPSPNAHGVSDIISSVLNDVLTSCMKDVVSTIVNDVVSACVNNEARVYIPSGRNKTTN